MKPYILFGGDDYEERGGAKDTIGFYDSPEEAKAEPKVETLQWAHVVRFTGDDFVFVAFYSAWLGQPGRSWLDA